ncbi:hypothetical protein TREES_T100000869 [Tupaia chinensis]|uniref:Uncharacterized protein n=1 Tax=Tupaia chinensis TaxID=246437 RepID=L9JEN5_TUPCH|nr:hypothetical protein TREES_T100000869 [Tupaia chinensis]
MRHSARPQVTQCTRACLREGPGHGRRGPYPHKAPSASDPLAGAVPARPDLSTAPGSSSSTQGNSGDPKGQEGGQEFGEPYKLPPEEGLELGHDGWAQQHQAGQSALPIAALSLTRQTWGGLLQPSLGTQERQWLWQHREPGQSTPRGGLKPTMSTEGQAPAFGLTAEDTVIRSAVQPLSCVGTAPITSSMQPWLQPRVQY